MAEIIITSLLMIIAMFAGAHIYRQGQQGETVIGLQRKITKEEEAWEN